jgi:hypothetical protein
LNQAIDAPADALPQLLIDWDAPAGNAASRLDAALESALGSPLTAESAAAATAQQAEAGPNMDTIEHLNAEIRRLQAEVRDARVSVQRVSRQQPSRSNPFRHFTNAIGNLISILITYAVIFGIGLAVIFFGGRRYIETVADTARHQTLRSMFVGLAGACLLLPAFVLGAVALVISIVGIPALLAWLPLFPVAAVLAVLLGYVSVAHAAGEALAERRFYATDWFQRGNSYYFLVTGLGLLVALFLASQIVSMAGPWLGFFSGLLAVLGAVATFIAVAVGFGAVLISRAGTRSARPAEPDLFTENPGA